MEDGRNAKPLRLAFVDDEPWALIGIQEVIDWKAYGFACAGAFGSAEEAYETLRENPVDAIITDIRLPGMSGLDLVNLLLKESLVRCAGIVSAYRDFEYARRAIAENVVYYLLKPINRDEAAHVAELMRDRLSEDAARKPEEWASEAELESNVYLDLNGAETQVEEMDSRPVDVLGYPKARYIISPHPLSREKLRSGMSRRHDDYSDWQTMVAEAKASQKMHFCYAENEMVSAIQFYIAQNYRDKLKNGDIARNFYLSEVYMSELFKKSTEMTIGNFIINIRMRQAMCLLEKTDLLISEIAEQVGYDDAGYFGRIFRKKVGESPERYRQNIGAARSR